MYLTKKLKIVFLFLFISFLNVKDLSSLENKILFKVDNEIITTIDIHEEIKFLKTFSPETNSLSEEELYEISKNSIIRDKIKKIEIMNYVEEIKVEDKFLLNLIKNKYSRKGIDTLENFENYLKSNNLNTQIIREKISIELTKSKNLVIARNLSENNFSFKEIERNLKKKLFYKESIITKSLYASGIETEIPIEIIIEFARLYGFQFDFQRDIWKNDSFQIVYEQYHDSKNTFIKNGEIIFAKLNLQGKEYPLYKFKSKDITDYFDERGQSVKKTLMKTPINGARLSSSFGMRKHPILGFNKMHKGTDFAAPMGTPIMASGDGKVIKSSWCGGGGNCIKIKHNSTYTTVYAHLSKFGRGIKKGVRVKQGQIIGYVGSTGMSTGPHLHYEVIENGKKINSQTLKLPSGKTLLGEERKKFEVEKIKIEILKSDLIYKS